MRNFFMLFLCLFFGVAIGQTNTRDTLDIKVFALDGKIYKGPHAVIRGLGPFFVKQDTHRNFVVLAELQGQDTVYVIYARHKDYKVWERTLEFSYLPEVKEYDTCLQVYLREDYKIDGKNFYAKGRNYRLHKPKSTFEDYWWMLDSYLNCPSN